MIASIDEHNAAFNAGNQARLNGEKYGSNPYKSSKSDKERQLYAVWRSGWMHVAMEWGKEVRGRWSVQPLPALAEFIFYGM